MFVAFKHRRSRRPSVSILNGISNKHPTTSSSSRQHPNLHNSGRFDNGYLEVESANSQDANLKVTSGLIATELEGGIVNTIVQGGSHKGHSIVPKRNEEMSDEVAQEMRVKKTIRIEQSSGSASG